MPKSTKKSGSDDKSNQVEPIETATPTETAKKSKKKQKKATTNGELVAIVIGGTGAVGRYVVRNLLKSDKWAKVIVIGRRKGTEGGYYEDDKKLVEVVVNFDHLLSEDSPAREAFEKYHPNAAFCCLGTTRADAGSDRAFKKVDYTFVTDFAHLAFTFKTKSFHLVSSQGADPSSVILYLRTKGKSEEYIEACNFPITRIYQPGLLGRDEPTSVEKCWGHFATALPCKLLGSVMVKSAEELLDPEKTKDLLQDSKSDQSTTDGSNPIILQRWKNKHILSFANNHNISKE